MTAYDFNGTEDNNAPVSEPRITLKPTIIKNFFGFIDSKADSWLVIHIFPQMTASYCVVE
jgi:hypothetical protein